MSDPTPCPKCGQPHPNCTAHSKRHGGPCGAKPMRGQQVCAIHGGKSPGAREAAQKRATEAAAEKELAALWPGLANQPPTKDPVDVLARTTTAIEAMVETIGDRINENGTSIAAGKDMTQLRAEIVLLDRLLDKLLKASEAMARLGIAERHVELEQARAQMVTAAFLAALGVLAERVTLLPADRDLVVRTFLEQLSTAVEIGGEQP